MAKKNQLKNRIAELRRASAWPHRVADVQILETHISWVILTGKFAYKFKKPVNFGFINYEDLQDRRHYCDLEVELNRRFAPQMYLGVVPVFDQNGSLIVGEETVDVVPTGATVIDYAVKMLEFPRDAIVSDQLKTTELPFELAEDFGRRLAHFHDSIEVAPSDLDCVQPRQVVQDALDNFDVLEEFFAGDNRLDIIERLRVWTKGQAVGLLPAFRRRLEQGMVRRCHGDLHLKNIICWQDRLQAFDGIEFNEALQWIDLLSELAFPVMDLVAREHPAHGWRLLNAYLEQSGDYAGLEVLRFYLVYRALVRAKVTCLNPANLAAAESLPNATDGIFRSGLTGTWDKYLQTAAWFAFQLTPGLTITHGFSGSGKSTAAIRLIDHEGGIRIRSDVERTRLIQSSDAAGKYSKQTSEQVYEHLKSLARVALEAGLPVMIDATFLQSGRRIAFQELAKTMNVEYRILDCDADFAELCRRISHRSGDPSEATREVLEAQMKFHDPLSPAELAFVRQPRSD